LWVEEGEHVVGPVATVAPVAPIDKLYSYSVPEELEDQVLPGRRVNVPLGRKGRTAPAFVVSVDQRPWDSTLRPVHSVIDSKTFLTDELLRLGQWMARYYVCPLGRTLAALVPAAVRKQTGHRTVERVKLAIEPGELDAATANHRVGPKQQAVLDRLTTAGEPVEIDRLRRDSGASRTTIRTLQQRGWLQIDAAREPAAPPEFDQPLEEPEFELNPNQQAALQRTRAVVDAGGFRVMLLFGVSGSGKTEVYIRSIRRVLESGQQAVMLVPEIALTTQLVHRIASRFENLAVIHSGLTDAHRSLTWSAVRAGAKNVVIGTRSAVFAPCPKLGLLVVDEEQESSYKNLQAPRFHVRDVAIKRAQELGIPVILGSATPSLESWHNCQRMPHFERIDLPHRVRNLPRPELTVVDMHDEFADSTGIPLLSRVLIERLRAAFGRGEQAVLLMNRRGYANWLVCSSCRHQIRCPDCNANMVLHADRREILCHHCSRRAPAPERCPNPSCRARLAVVGSGTERIVERLEHLFPDARIARADSDVMRHERAYRRLIADFAERRTDCLVGTQMIAKGLDFPHVSVVGVIAADATLTSTDFRTAERLFQLVTQVAGRAGRGGVPGEVIVQTLSPESVALQAAVTGDYEVFASEELHVRRETRMPPSTRLARLVLGDTDESRVREASRGLVEQLRGLVGDADAIEILGPMRCTLTRLRKRYRYEIIVRAEHASGLQRLFDNFRRERSYRPKVGSFVIDVDPVSFA
jgi:primosomal protein N' (replication factor Y)